MNLGMRREGLSGSLAVQLARVQPSFSVVGERLLSAWSWLNQKYAKQRTSKRIKVLETAALGEKRFVTILQVDGAQFLIGGTAASVSLLASLEPKPAFADVMKMQSEAAAEQL